MKISRFLIGMFFVATAFTQELITDDSANNIKTSTRIMTQQTSSDKNSIALTDEEQVWINANPVIKAWSPINYPPYSFEDNGQLLGFVPDYLKLLTKKLGLEVEFIHIPLRQAIQEMTQGSIDVMGFFIDLPQYEKLMSYTPPYITGYEAVFVQINNNGINNLSDLSGKSFALIQGYPTFFLPDDVEIVWFDTVLEALSSVALGETDATIANVEAAGFFIRKQGLGTLTATFKVDLDQNTAGINYVMGVRKNIPILATLLSKAMASIPEKEMIALEKEWFDTYNIYKDYSEIELTEEEKKWVKSHPVIRMRVGNNPPDHFYEDGAKGVSVDIIKTISEMYGFKVKFVSHQTRSEALKSIKEHKNVDVLPLTIPTPELEEYMVFSQPYIKDSVVVFTQKNDTEIFSMENLFDKTVIVAQDYAVQKQIEEAYPQIKLKFADTPLEAMQEVNNGNADAYIGNLTISRYEMIHHGVTSIKVAAPTTFADHQFSFSIRDDWPELATILNKGLASISPEERAEFHYKYYLINPNKSRTKYLILLWTLLGSGIILLIILFWNHTLRKKVAESTLEVTKYSEHLEELVSERTKEAKDTSKRLTSLFEHMPNGFAEHEIIQDENGKVIDYRYLNINPAFSKQTGLNKNIIGKTVKEIMPEIEQDWIDVYADVALAGTSKSFEQYAAPLKKYFEVHAFSSDNNKFAVLFEDITPRKEIEEKLEQANFLSHMSLNLAGAASWYMDVANFPDRIFITPEVAKIHGLPDPDNTEYVRIKEIRENAMKSNPKAGKTTFDLLEDAISNGTKNYDSTWQYTRPYDGKAIWLRSLAQSETNEDGIVTDIYGVTQDITELKANENLIKEQRGRFKALFEQSSGAYLILDKNLFVDCNQAAVELFGYSKKEELINTPPWDLSPVLQPNRQPSAILAQDKIEYAYKNKSNSFEWIHRKKDGTEFPCKVMLTRMELSGRPMILTILHDLTEIKQSQQSVQDSQQQLNMALHAANLGLWDWNIETNMIFTSDIWHSMLGYEAKAKTEEFEKTEMLVLPEFHELVAQKIKDHIEGRTELYRFELKMYCADRSEKWILSIAQICERNADGKPTRMIGIHSDITKMRELQDELTNAKEIAEANARAKADFLSNMSHEIRTPLNAVIGMSYLMSKTNLNEKQSAYLQKMQNSSNILMETLNNILDFSKIEAGKIKLEHIAFDVEDLLNKIMDVNSVPANVKGVELEVFYSNKDIPTLIGDPTRITQVLNNLVSNAIKFTEQGTVTINCKITNQVEKYAVVEFCVQDTGIGLSEKQSKNLFEAFTQADTSITREYGGTGLGLSICKSFVELMDGEIWVESKLEQGSNFIFRLPLDISETCIKTKHDTNSSENISEVEQSVHGARILVAEDNPATKTLRAKYLNS